MPLQRASAQRSGFEMSRSERCGIEELWFYGDVADALDEATLGAVPDQVPR